MNINFPWIQIFIVFNIIIFTVSALINHELNKSKKPAPSINSLNNFVYTLSLISLTSIISIYLTRKLGCKEPTSGRNFNIIALIFLLIMSIISFGTYVMILNNNQINDIKDTNVKSYATINIVLLIMSFLYGIYMFYESFKQKTIN